MQHATQPKPSPARKPPRLDGRLIAVTLALIALTAAHADSRVPMPRERLAAYAQECAACHTAYPPGLLPAASWQRLMGSLDRHFGTDASLDAGTKQRLDAWLQANAGTGRRTGASPPQDRITRSAWFQRKHRKVDAAVWKLPSVRSAANCTACHIDAERGDFDDDRLRMPAGLDARLRRSWDD